MPEENKLNDNFSGYIREKVEKIAPGGGGVDVVSSYDWTATKIPDAFRQEIPRISLKEKRQNYSQIYNSFLYNSGAKLQGFNAGALGAEKIDFDITKLASLKSPFVKEEVDEAHMYDNLYIGDDTGNSYVFPFFSKDFFNTKSSWTEVGGLDILQKLPKAAAEFAGSAADAILKSIDVGRQVFSTSAFTEAVKGYAPSVDGPTISFAFTLFNNISPGRYVINYDLVQTLIKQNLHTRQKKFTVIPPVYYEMEIAGLRYSPASYISSLDIKNEGTVRIIDNMMIPEAYTISITLTDLISSTSNFITNDFGSNGANKITVIKSRSLIKDDTFRKIGL